jgi:hypothetical protein
MWLQMVHLGLEVWGGRWWWVLVILLVGLLYTIVCVWRSGEPPPSHCGFCGSYNQPHMAGWPHSPLLKHCGIYNIVPCPVATHTLAPKTVMYRFFFFCMFVVGCSYYSLLPSRIEAASPKDVLLLLLFVRQTREFKKVAPPKRQRRCGSDVPVDDISLVNTYALTRSDRSIVDLVLLYHT